MVSALQPSFIFQRFAWRGRQPFQPSNLSAFRRPLLLAARHVPLAHPDAVAATRDLKYNPPP